MTRSQEWASVDRAINIIANANTRTKAIKGALRYLWGRLDEIICFANFHDATVAKFTPCELPARTPDYVSMSGSQYWDTGEGVIRLSDHWGAVKSCRWYLAGASTVRHALNGEWWIAGGETEGQIHVGYCAYAAFRRVPVHNGVRMYHTITEVD